MTDTQALDITVYEPMAVMPVLDIRAAIVRQQALTDFVSKIMHENTDFGTIPGTDKPTLLKPGAEKLTTFFGLSKRFVLVERTEDWTGANHSGEPFFYYLYRCQLYGRNNTLIAEADGSASSWESKYRYRNSERVCPSCGKAAIIKGKAEYGGGWLCFNKKGGCGAKFADKDKQITEQITGKVPNPDPADTVNTILKMSQKRALIAATLLAVNASEFFTQDMEDFVDADYTVHNAQPAPVVKVERPAPTGPAWTQERKPEPAPWGLRDNAESMMEAPHLQSPTKPVAPAQDAANDAAFETLPSASAERNGANGKTTPATKHSERPFRDQGTAVQWACRFEYYQKRDKNGAMVADVPHAVGAIQKICDELGCTQRDVDTWADAFMDHVAVNTAASLTHAEADAQAAGDELPVFESR